MENIYESINESFNEKDIKRGMDFLSESIRNSYIEGVISDDDYDNMMQVIQEGPISKAKKFLEQIKLIKSCKPDEYMGEAEVKKFVDNNYDKLVKIADYMDEEPEKLKTKQTGSAVLGIVGYGVWAAGMIAGFSTGMLLTGIAVALIGFISFVVGVVASLVYARKSDVDRDVVDNLTKIKRGLKSVDKNKLEDKTAKKISTIIDKIDDAEVAWNASVKTESTSESKVENSVSLLLESVQNAYISGSITESEYTSIMTTIEESAVSASVAKPIKDLMDAIKRTISSLKNKKPKDENEKKVIDKTIKYQEIELKRLGDSILLTNDPDEMSSMNSDLLLKVGHKIRTESTDLTVIASHIFEAFNAGEITYDEKNDLLIQLVEGYNYK